MNIITVSGSTKKKRLLAESVTYFMVEELLPRHRTLQIEISLSDLMLESGVCGFCNAFTPREFLIEIDKKIDAYAMIETICHEMIHVKQHARRELKNYDYKEMSVLWKNERYSIEPENYNKFPWEKEAYEYEFIYAKKFLEMTGVL
jgi:hypothetical protein